MNNDENIIMALHAILQTRVDLIGGDIVKEAVEKFEQDLRMELAKRSGLLLEQMISYSRNGTDLNIIIHDRFKNSD